ncbi:MAG: hypothetical protein AAGI38_24390, partial [Bacteroidota bacterium]
HMGDEKNYRNEFYSHGVLIEIQLFQKDTLANEEIIEFYDSSNELYAIQNSLYDSKGRVLHHRQWNANEQLMLEIENEYNGETLTNSKTKDFSNGQFSERITYEYNPKDELIHVEKRSLDGTMREFQKFSYDRLGRCIEEVRVQNGGVNASFGGGERLQKVHLIHRYE